MYFIDFSRFHSGIEYTPIFSGGMLKMHPDGDNLAVYDNTIPDDIFYVGDRVDNSLLSEGDLLSAIYDGFNGRYFSGDNIPAYATPFAQPPYAGEIDTTLYQDSGAPWTPPNAITVFLICAPPDGKNDTLTFNVVEDASDWKINFSAGYRAQMRGNFGSRTNGVSNSTEVPFGDFVLITVIFDRNNSDPNLQTRLWVNGDESGTTVANNDDIGSEPFGLGYMRLAFQGKIAGLLIYDGAMDDTSRIAEESRLSTMADLHELGGFHGGGFDPFGG